MKYIDVIQFKQLIEKIAVEIAQINYSKLKEKKGMLEQLVENDTNKSENQDKNEDEEKEDDEKEEEEEEEENEIDDKQENEEKEEKLLTDNDLK